MIVTDAREPDQPKPRWPPSPVRRCQQHGCGGTCPLTRHATLEGLLAAFLLAFFLAFLLSLFRALETFDRAMLCFLRSASNPILSFGPILDHVPWMCFPEINCGEGTLHVGPAEDGSTTGATLETKTRRVHLGSRCPRISAAIQESTAALR
jgi:hypothetical protein